MKLQNLRIILLISIMSVFVMDAVILQKSVFCQSQAGKCGDGICDDFEKAHPDLCPQDCKQPASDNILQPLYKTAEISIDYSKEKGEFSKYLFTVDLEGDEHSYKLAKEAGFQAAAFIQFNSSDSSHFGTPEMKMYLLDKYRLAGVDYWEVEADKPLTQVELEAKAADMLSRINALEQKYPNAKIGVFLFGNEPDFPFSAHNTPPEAWHWKGTQEQFFQNYEIFARYLKSKDKNYIVGTPGFAPEVFFLPSAPSDWPEKLLKYVYEHNVPLDFISFHSYSTDIKISISDQIDKLNRLLDIYPVKSPIFGRPKIACNEYDIRAQVLTDNTYYNSYDTVWRAAHNVLGALSMIDKGVWLISEWAGPVQFVGKDDPYDISMAWIRKDGYIKPVYYGHKLLNNLANTIQIDQTGSNFQTFGVMAGKSGDGKIINIVIANYDEYGVLREQGNDFGYPPPVRQPKSTPVFNRYKIAIKGLPICKSERVQVEKYLVDQNHEGELVETTFLPCQEEITIEGNSKAPDVQLIKITR
ncbi:MAG: hypothetical protein PHT50_06530 [Candidatus Omnitrophica bacterium]|nr:hypothetical protein [Candidatus Omnitrophota bacterium]